MSTFVDRTPGKIDLANDTLLASPSVNVVGSEYTPEYFKRTAKEKRWLTIEKRGFCKGSRVEMVDGIKTIISGFFSNGEIEVESFPGKRINPLSLKLV